MSKAAMRHLSAAALMIACATTAAAQPKTPKSFPPDAATRAVIDAKLASLRTAVGRLNPKSHLLPDVAVYLKAAERAVRLDEWLAKDTAKQTVAVLDAGLKRADAMRNFRADWREVRDKPFVRGYVSPVDGSIQPYVITITSRPTADLRVPQRMDMALHGRDGTLSEVKVIAQAEAAKPVGPRDYSELQVFGRGNNAYRWAGEVDIYDSYNSAQGHLPGLYPKVLRGFSMGGAGTWHFGLHHPFLFNVIGPGAGFTTTHGYAKVPAELPDYQERCLTIYDAVDVAENVSIVPVVVYAGANDKQKAAADNVIAALKDFEEPHTLTQLVAPGLEHKMPPEWQAKAEAEYAKHVAAGDAVYAAGDRREPFRYVLYTTAYGRIARGRYEITGLDRHYTKAVLQVNADRTVIRTTNIRAVMFAAPTKPITIDGQSVTPPEIDCALVKTAGRWAAVPAKHHVEELLTKPRKTIGLQGPIDDAFMRPFAVGPAPAGDSPVAKSLAASRSRFAGEWDRYLHGELRELTPEWTGGRVLFGTPDTPAVAAVLPKLPVTWTADKLVVNGVEYDPKTHYPVMIYPDPASPSKYLVLNSGHTFHKAEFEGSNALLFPRLGDWAVLKLAPTAADPAATETVAAGLFAEDWQFEK